MILKNCNMKTFFQRCENKKIVYFGIGSEFERALKNYAGYPWEKKAGFLVDNSQEKTGTEFIIGQHSYKILDLQGLIQENLSNCVMLITCSYYAEIVEQLNSISKFDHIDCYIYYFMFTLHDQDSICIRQRTECLIPPVIHYCWFGKGDLPDFYKRCMESWYKYCPEYTIKEWNEDNCDINENDFVKQAYEMKKYGFVPDYFRLKIIYENGGIYLDTDVELLRNPDDLRYNEAFCGMQVPGEVAFGLGFGAVAGHPVLKKLMKRYSQMQFVENEAISPALQTKDLMDIGMRYGNCQQEVMGMSIYPVEVLSPMNLFTKEIYKTQFSYAIHYYDGSWVSDEKRERNRKRQEDIGKLIKMMKK